MKIALAVSVALNVFGVATGGAVWVMREKVGAWMADANRSPRGEPVWDVVERLAPAVRDQVKRDLRANAMLARPDFEEAREARREAIALTGAETFDPVAVAALLERSRASEMRGRSRLEAGAVEILGRLSPADRKALAPILSRHRARKPEKPAAPVAPTPAEAPVQMSGAQS
ncbi:MULTISPECIES: periplasmic heavy metal sensor [unclassified Brevundimonas]|uniref:periplasmic heavy metal sensor n=1 Tax=unclassified Brevundimonas TaxID=2622653 RepID=UPI003F93C89C